MKKWLSQRKVQHYDGGKYTTVRWSSKNINFTEVHTVSHSFALNNDCQDE
jgi:phage antirepressor YoqD-like protein